MNIKNKNSGFTLIELIFVVAIIGVTLTLGLSYVSKLAERTKEKTASLQIQQILQAAMTYYVQKNDWPKDGNTSKPDADFAQKYIPAISALATNPWGSNNYSWTHQTTEGRLFTVSTIVPDTNTAARLASLLPNASYNKTTLNSQIAIPGQAQELPKGYILKVGELPELNLNKSNLDLTGDFEVFPLASNANEATLATNCTNAGNTIVVKPYIRSYRIYGFIVSDETIKQLGIDVYQSMSPTNTYCVHYHLMGDKYAAIHYIFVDKVIIGYTVFCMPPG
jgi:prepilin-type N-terminal cleavage/methylation domain-containing protein